MAAEEIYIGATFGKLTVIEPIAGRGINGRLVARCRCSCGREVVMTRRALHNGSNMTCRIPPCVPEFYVWNSERDDTLRALWAEGLSAKQIGDQMGVSRNAIIGRARRIGCSARPSPIVQNGQRVVMRALGSGCLAFVPQQGAPLPPVSKRIRKSRAKVAQAPADPPKPLRLFNPPIRTALPATVIPPCTTLPRQEKSIPLGSKANKWSGPTCCWIYGDPKAEGGPLWCQEERREGKAYCAAHCLEAYVPNVKRPEAA